jgi:hypothetical protein
VMGQHPPDGILATGASIRVEMIQTVSHESPPERCGRDPRESKTGATRGTSPAALLHSP